MFLPLGLLMAALGNFALASNRYVAVAYPLSYKKMFTLGKMRFFLLSCVVVTCTLVGSTAFYATDVPALTCALGANFLGPLFVFVKFISFLAVNGTLLVSIATAKRLKRNSRNVKPKKNAISSAKDIRFANTVILTTQIPLHRCRSFCG